MEDVVEMEDAVEEDAVEEDLVVEEVEEGGGRGGESGEGRGGGDVGSLLSQDLTTLLQSKTKTIITFCAAENKRLSEMLGTMLNSMEQSAQSASFLT